MLYIKNSFKSICNTPITQKKNIKKKEGKKWMPNDQYTNERQINLISETGNVN